MKRYLILILLAAYAGAQTTPNLHLNTPLPGTPNWGPAVNSNFIMLDTWSATVCPKSACTMTGPLTLPTLTATTSVTSPNFIATTAITTPTLMAGYFTQTATPLTADIACTTGTFWIAPVTGSTNTWRMCSNGALSSIGGGGTVTGQASGVIPLGTGATSIGAQSHLDDGVTTAGVITSTEPIAGTSASFSGNLAAAAAAAAVSDKGGQTYSVKGYDAKGDGSTNDCTAITAANTARESAGGGELFFPAGQYVVGSACHLILAQPGTVRGVGSCGVDQTKCASTLKSTDTTGVLFTVTAQNFLFDNIALSNTATTASGAGIFVNGTNALQKVNYSNVSVTGFYDDIDHWVGALWSMSQSYLGPSGRYDIWIQNTVAQDSGDWAITSSFINMQSSATLEGIHITGAGGGKIVGNKIIGTPVNGITQYGITASNATTGQLLIIGNSIEQITGSAINIPHWAYLTVANNYLNNSQYSTTSPFICSICPAVSFSGGTINVVNTGGGFGDITMGAGSSGVVGPYVKNSGNTNANSYASAAVADYSMTAGDISATSGNLYAGTLGVHASTATLHMFGGSNTDSSIQSSFGAGGVSFQTNRDGVNFGGYQWLDSTGAQVMALNTSTKVLSGVSLGQQAGFGATTSVASTTNISAGNTFTNGSSAFNCVRPTGSGNCYFNFYRGATVAQTGVVSGGTLDWSLGNNNTTNFQLLDRSNSNNVINIAQGGPANALGMNANGLVFGGLTDVSTFYSAAGTALPACAAGTKGSHATVIDATAPTFMAAYVSGGAITADVLCSYNGSVYTWLTK